MFMVLAQTNWYLEKNPNFPAVVRNKLPALEGKTTSEIVACNLNAMHAARQAFIKSTVM